MMALIKAQLLTFVRDRGLLVATFALPVIVYLIFASIFSATSGGAIKVSALVVDQQNSDYSARLTSRLLDVEVLDAAMAQDLAPSLQAVSTGAVDVLIQIAGDRQALEALDADKPAPILIYTAPGRKLSRLVATGALQAAFQAALPDVIVKKVAELIDTQFAPFDEIEKSRIDIGQIIIAERAKLGVKTGLGSDNLIETIEQEAGPDVSVIYYASAVAILFGLLTALNLVQHLNTGLQSGLLGRLRLTGIAVGRQVDAMFGLIVGLVLLQFLAVFVTAWLVFDVALPANAPAWLLSALLSAGMAAGFALLFAALCQSAKQVQLIGSTVVLILSALGGSMIPRYLMPDSFQALGWFTPNTWSLEAMALIFWRPAGLQELTLTWLVLAGNTLVLWVAARLAWRWKAR